jgi:hypothetical protein
MTLNGHAGRTEFLRPAERRYAEFSVRGFGKVRIQSITEKERHQFESSLLNESGAFDKNRAAYGRVKFITLCVVDADGYRILSDSDVPTIYEQQDAAVIEAIYSRCKEHCNIEEDQEKNSEGLPETVVADSPSS